MIIGQEPTMMRKVPACTPGPKAQGYLPKNSECLRTHWSEVLEEGSFRLFTMGLRAFVVEMCLCLVNISKKNCFFFVYAFVAFLVSVHGVASTGGENLKSPEGNEL